MTKYTTAKPTHTHYCPTCRGRFYCYQPATKMHGCLLPDWCWRCEYVPKSEGYGDAVAPHDIQWVTITGVVVRGER